MVLSCCGLSLVRRLFCVEVFVDEGLMDLGMMRGVLVMIL